ncbi:MAG: hypothetical protein V4604_00730 [Bacteroidota bacterium]
MGMHADKIERTEQPQAVASPTPVTEPGILAAVPATGTHQQLKTLADQSSQISQLRTYSDLANSGEKVTQLRTVQQLADNNAVIQLKKWSTGKLDGKQTNVTWKTGTLGGDTVGVEMEATLLGPDHPQGTPPKSGAQKKLMNQLPTDPKNDNEDKYIRGHLLNDNLGGLGEPENMFPITANANKAHEKVIESKVKQWVNEDKQWVYYHVKVKDVKNKLKQGYVNAVFDCEASVLDDFNNPINTIKADIVSEYKKVKVTDDAYAEDNGEREDIGTDAMDHVPLLSKSKKVREKLSDEIIKDLILIFEHKVAGKFLRGKMLEYEGIGKVTVDSLKGLSEDNQEDKKVVSAMQKVISKIGTDELIEIIAEIYDECYD